MGSGISLNNKQALEILKSDIKQAMIYKTKFTNQEKEKYEQLIAFFRNFDKSQGSNNTELIGYRNWLYDCEYDRLLKKL
jgi:hypothetical protein